MVDQHGELAELLRRALQIADEIGDSYLGALVSDAHDVAAGRVAADVVADAVEHLG